MDVVILCGGLGTRLASVISGIPKPLAFVNNKPFLNYILDYLNKFPEITRIVLATGHLSEKVEENYGKNYDRFTIEYSVEKEPLGTGGAVLNAIRKLKLSDSIIIINGDSFSEVNYSEMVRLHGENNKSLLMAATKVEDASRFGSLETKGSLVIGFNEKKKNINLVLINAGVYLTSIETLYPWLNDLGKLSLEKDIFPVLAVSKAIKFYEFSGKFIDIGLPETLKSANKLFI